MPDDPIGEIYALGLPPPNYDEGNLSIDPPLLAREEGGIDASARQEWLSRFASEVYGTCPPPPDSLEIERRPIRAEPVERVIIRLRLAGGTFVVDAGLWLPADTSGPVPVILGLDFKGPIGILTGEGFPLDREARMPPVFEGEGLLTDALRGTSAHRWPVDLLIGAGFAVLVSCYGSWVPDDPALFETRGLYPLIGSSIRGARPGAIALWGWAISRLVDVAGLIPEIDPGAVAVAGHSRLGKAALWAAANDERIGSALINNSGAMGASLSSRNYGETRQHVEGRFPHWLSPDARAGAEPLDQHQLLASVAPRQLYVASASEDLWADPKGEYIALQAAAPAWPDVDLPGVDSIFAPGREVASGALAWHLRPGPHDIRPYDWHRYLRHLQELPGFASRGA
jgi:hypothetical protein